MLKMASPTNGGSRAQLSIEKVIHRRFQVVTLNTEITADAGNREKMTMPHLQATPVICASLPSVLSAIAIEYRDHSGLDRVVRELKTIAHAEFLKNIVEVSFDGALGDREPICDFVIPKAGSYVANNFGLSRRQFLAARTFLSRKFRLHCRWHPYQAILDRTQSHHPRLDRESFLHNSLGAQPQGSNSIFGSFPRG